MLVESRRDLITFLKGQVPDVFIKRRFNFITIHYFYFVGMIILISVIIYGIGDIRYIDSLFFASGTCTQSGLNTVDVNLIKTGQQVMLYLGAMFCNPIVVHSFVVFVRLYWFEKRFEDIAREARALRRTKSKSRTNTMNKDDLESGRPETGVRGRAIRILRNTARLDQPMEDEKADVHNKGKVVDSSESSPKDSEEGHQRDPTDPPMTGVRSNSTDEMRLPQQMSPEQHIRFLENQRNPQDKSALYIPSPREFDRGGRPENIDDEIERDIVRQMTSHQEGSHEVGRADQPSHTSAHITIDEPNILRTREKTSTFPRANTKQSTQSRPQEGPRPGLQTGIKRAATSSTLRRSSTTRMPEATPYLSYQATIGRNSFFMNLDEKEREELGGIEYRALKTLALVLILYFFCFHFLGIICLTPWIIRTPSYGKAVTDQGQGRVWWGIFTSASVFNDLGFTLTNDSMISFGGAVFPMLLMTFLIVIGNTGFPCMLRFVIWVASKVVPYRSPLWEELQFLLDHPRRCFTLLFPRMATWWLFAILVMLNGVDLIFFFILDLHVPAVTGLSPGIRFIDGLFQASSTRTAGFSVVNLANLHPGIQVSYLIMMYISVFPIAISMRRTNVYEEKSLGIYSSAEEQEDDEKEPSYVGAHLRKQLSFDLWYIFLGMFIIAIVEGSRLQNVNQPAFTLFSVLFEIVSAYGTVGLSLGYPTINASFSAEFQTLSKLVIIAMQIRGRHRGLPYELDRAILLPSEGLHAKEAKEAERRMMRRRSSTGMSTMSAVDGQIESRKFRPETGLTSGFEVREPRHVQQRGRVDFLEPQRPRDDDSLHEHGARQGLGSVMHKMACMTEGEEK